MKISKSFVFDSFPQFIPHCFILPPSQFISPLLLLCYYLLQIFALFFLICFKNNENKSFSCIVGIQKINKHCLCSRMNSLRIEKVEYSSIFLHHAYTLTLQISFFFNSSFRNVLDKFWSVGLWSPKYCTFMWLVQTLLCSVHKDSDWKSLNTEYSFQPWFSLPTAFPLILYFCKLDYREYLCCQFQVDSSL